LIFSIADHIPQIKARTKTQTRRIRGTEWYPRYQTGKYYRIQPGRGKKSIEDGEIQIKRSWIEYRGDTISEENALAEGGYTPEKYEALFIKMYPHWGARWAYEFVYVPYHVESDK